jgi:hypothetical protein
MHKHQQSPKMGDSKLKQYIRQMQKAFADRFHTAAGWQSVVVDAQYALECMKRKLKPNQVLDTMVEP